MSGPMHDEHNPDEPTEEELQQYFAQMREVPVQELLMQAISVLATGAEVKIGLADARPLIDAMEAVVGVAAPLLGEATGQIQQAIVQLKTFQVQAEKQMAEQGGAPATGTSAADAGSAQPSAPSSTQASSAATPPAQPEQRATDKLWIPGKD